MLKNPNFPPPRLMGKYLHKQTVGVCQTFPRLENAIKAANVAYSFTDSFSLDTYCITVTVFSRNNLEGK